MNADDDKPHSLDYERDVAPAEDGGRLDAPAFHRNKDAIASVLIELGDDRPTELLEIACGTGQHAAYIARMWPEVTWWPSDLTEAHVASAAAWAKAGRVANVRPPVQLDVCDETWMAGDGIAGLPDAFDIVFAANIIHIAAWEVTVGLVRGAERRLKAAGALVLYGPFMVNGAHRADSNRQFDEDLKARNPDWGVRDLTQVEQLAAGEGLFLRQEIAMPANNMCVVFRR
jgi:SAM-dependent methyltransferase